MQSLLTTPLLLILAAAPPRPTVDWLTGSQFQRQLESTTAFTWSENPLNRAVSNLARSKRVAIFLDRRIDPGQRVTLAMAEKPLEQVLHELAGSLHMGVSVLEPVIYIGPPEMARRLATLAANRRDEVGRLPSAARSRWRRSDPWSWDRLATPRQLLGRLSQETGCRIANADAVPHDLWPATDLPAMPAADRLCLLLAGFSLTFELSPNGTEARLRAPPEKVTWQRTYRPPANVQQALRVLVERFPQSTVKRLGRRLRVTGSYEDHHQIRRWLSGETPLPVDAGDADNKRHTLEIESVPAGAVVKAIAKQLQLSLEITPELTTKLQQRVTFRVRDVKLAELLHATLDPVQVHFRLDGGKLTLTSGE